ncbi:phage tail protein [Acetatifactor muris]|uniref:Uncharacterized protein n=1 Tax=Acetatifactor muris TaxID=879566 RepID=A0A2K4ZNI9_9FIRM|nr:phage tail protein [Acetatifactor muris]MCR2050381.1 phage tail protein [Acetatifactor muris]SOY32048.1 hypothetical protein AMURIS_04801 [Acetatifactor muris]
MRITRDFFDNPIIPDYVLCKSNKERIGILQCTNKTIDFNFNNLDEINFTTYLYIDGIKNPYYDLVNDMKYILLPDVGFFSITSINITSEGSKLESKSVTAKSYECLLANKNLEEFVINMGTVESIDGVQFYNLRDKSKSLLHLILEKCPDWEIGHIDTSLITMQRSFEITKQDIYSFLNNDVASAFECYFLFDTLNNTINIYKEDNIGKDTNICVSYINLLKNTNISCNMDNIKTCLTITGSDDLTVREINMGYDKIYNFGYYNSTEYMSAKLYNAYNSWVALRKLKLPIYTSLLSQYQNYLTQINFLEHEKMPSTSGSTNWEEYGLQPLKEQLSAYEQKQSVSMKSGHGDPSSSFYNSEYLPIYNTIQDITSQIKKVENQINSLKNNQISISNEMNTIISDVDIQNNFSQEELKELCSFIREDDLNSSNYIVTDTMTNDEKFEMLHSLLEFGERELAKASIPQLLFSSDIINLFAIPEFEEFCDEFEPGNYIWVTLRDDFSIKAKLLSTHINFYNPADFSVTFGNIVRNTKDRYLDIAEIIRTTSDVATSVSFNSSYWSQSAKDTSLIGKILDEGLIAAGKYLKNGDDSEMIIDTRGIFVNTISGDYAYKDSIFVGGGRILFTSDNWKTVSMSVGRTTVTIKGVTESRFGTFADFVIAGYIGGSVLEGDEIIGGIIKSSNYVPSKSGSFINLSTGTFEFNASNEQKLTLDENGLLTVKGIIKAEEGWIGGKDAFIIKNGKLYSKKDSLISNIDGIYIGTDGIALGANSKFKALSDGTLYAEKGFLGGTNGFVLETNKIYNGKSSISNASNGIYIGTDGIALGANSIFKITVQGVLTAKSGTIGDFTINNAIYNGKTSPTSAENGVYIGKGGIALGANNVFSVTQNGVITAASGTIGGAKISNNAIYASNGNWYIYSNGSASFKNIYVTGVQNGSNFGSLNYNNGVTWGNFNGSSYYGSNVSSPFSGTCVTHIESLSANYIKANYIDAINVDIRNLFANEAALGSLIAEKASITELNAAVARIGTLETSTISSNEVYTNFMEVKNWVSAGYIRADKINVEQLDADKIVAKTTGSAIISCNMISVQSGHIKLNGTMYGIKKIIYQGDEVFVLTRV